VTGAVGWGGHEHHGDQRRILLWPYAWLAFATMCVVIGIALLAEKSLVRPAAKSGIG